MFFVMQIRIIFPPPPIFVASSLGALGSCPNRLPLDPPLPHKVGAFSALEVLDDNRAL